MGIFPEKSCFQLAIDTADWHLSLIAVTQRLLHTKCRRHFNIGQTSNLIKTVLDLLAFEVQLSWIVQMPQVSNPRTQISHINIFIALVWSMEKFLHLAKADFFVDLEHTHPDELTRQGIFHKENQAFCLGHSCSLMAQIHDFNFNHIILF